MDEAMPEPTGRRRRGPAPEPSFPRGAALVAALKAIAARHPLTQADAASIREHVGRWRHAVLGEPGPSGRHGIGGTAGKHRYPPADD